MNCLLPAFIQKAVEDERVENSKRYVVCIGANLFAFLALFVRMNLGLQKPYQMFFRYKEICMYKNICNMVDVGQGIFWRGRILFVPSAGVR